MQFLCDTNIISELAKNKPNAGVLDWAAGIKECALSIITIEELNYGLSWKPNTRVKTWLDEFTSKFTSVLPVTVSVAEKAGIMRGQFQSQGIIRTQADMFIAATAAEHGLTIVTRNIKDFDGCGVSLLNPFI